jgi:hypothetical protein
VVTGTLELGVGMLDSVQVVSTDEGGTSAVVTGGGGDSVVDGVGRDSVQVVSTELDTGGGGGISVV